MKKFEQVKQLYNTMSVEYAQHSDSSLFVSGITSDFDRLFELCWKTLKEYLQKEKYIEAAKTGSPKDILKLAYQQKLINNEEIWLKILVDRNDDAHHYNESSARSYAARIEREYLKWVGTFIDELSELIPEEKGILVNVPSSFLEAVHRSGMYYDEFLEKVKQENAYSSELELFMQWDKIKDKYVN
ncbi:MAG: HI0074 family nucleotidyltransferase substrate-binding subunit [Lachnospiraceae bacterium]